MQGMGKRAHAADAETRWNCEIELAAATNPGARNLWRNRTSSCQRCYPKTHANSISHQAVA